MGNKKGSHVGMILSFVIFITFIVFLYTVIQPMLNTGEDKKATLEYLEIRIIQNVSLNLTTASVEFNNTWNTQNCVRLKNFLILSEIPPYILVKNETQSVQDAYMDFGDLLINRKSRENHFFKIYSSPDFKLLGNITLSCRQINDADYTIGSIKTGKYIFEKKLFYLMDYYKSNYETLRTELKIPPGNEFGFGFVETNGTKIEVEQETKSANVYVKEIPIQYVDNQANIQSGFINIKVW
jgi:hypothetical protein